MYWNQFNDSRIGSYWGYPWYPFGGSFINEYKIRNRLRYPVWVNRYMIPAKSSVVIPAMYLGNGVNIFGTRGIVSNAYFPLSGGSIGCGTAQGRDSGTGKKVCEHSQAGIRVKYVPRFNHSDEIHIHPY